METMETESEWKNETEKHQDKMAEFLKNYFDREAEERPRYDWFSDLHFSGTNVDTLDKIKNGTAKIISINVFYVAGKIEQIHAVFDGEKGGHNIDVYLKKKALDDYLEN